MHISREERDDVPVPLFKSDCQNWFESLYRRLYTDRYDAGSAGHFGAKRENAGNGI